VELVTLNCIHDRSYMKYLVPILFLLQACSWEQFTDRRLAVSESDTSFLAINDTLAILPVKWPDLKDHVEPDSWILLASAGCPGVKKHFAGMINELDSMQARYIIVMIDDHKEVPKAYPAFREWAGDAPILVLDERHHGRYMDVRAKNKVFRDDLYGDRPLPNVQAAFNAFRLDHNKEVLLHTKSMGMANSVAYKEDSLRSANAAQVEQQL
jgi:hypothetical protein